MHTFEASLYKKGVYVMTAMELQQIKSSLIENYIDKIDSIELSQKVEKALKRLIKKENPRPCVVHSQEEMIAAIRESEEDIKHGRIISSDDLEKEMETWF